MCKSNHGSRHCVQTMPEECGKMGSESGSRRDGGANAEECKIMRDSLERNGVQVQGTLHSQIAVDCVWVYQFGAVTGDERLTNEFILGERVLQSACLRRAVDWYGRVLLDDNAGACVKVSFLHEEVIFRTLMDTGAGQKDSGRSSGNQPCWKRPRGCLLQTNHR